MEPGVAAAWVAIVVTLGIAIVGWSRANRANGEASRATELAERSATAAERSASEARRANELTREANERAARAEARAITRSDVRWDTRVDGSNWVLTNTGLDDAADVVVILRTGEAPSYQRIEVGEVTSLGSATVVDIADLRRDKAAASGALVSDMHRAGITYFPSSNIPLHQRVLWADSVGGSHTTDEEEHDIG